MKKKILGITGIALCVLLILSAAFRIITWSLFWIGILIMAGFAYFVLPRMKD